MKIEIDIDEQYALLDLLEYELECSREIWESNPEERDEESEVWEARIVSLISKLKAAK